MKHLILRWYGQDISQLWLRVYENHSTLSLCLICRLKAPIKQDFCPWPASRPLPSQALQLNLSEIAKGDKRVCCLTKSWQGKSQTKRFRNGKTTFYYVLTICCPKDKRVHGLYCVLVILCFHAFDCRNVLIHNPKWPVSIAEGLFISYTCMSRQ